MGLEFGQHFLKDLAVVERRLVVGINSKVQAALLLFTVAAVAILAQQWLYVLSEVRLNGFYAASGRRLRSRCRPRRECFKRQSTRDYPDDSDPAICLNHVVKIQ